jgi:hypothetical protein
MGEIRLITYLLPGARASLAEQVLCVENRGDRQYFDATDLSKVLPERAENLDFRTFLEVSTDAPRISFLIQADMSFEGDFTQRGLRLIKQGAVYTTELDMDIELPGVDGEIELRCDLAQVVAERPDGALLLGVLRVVTE